MKWATAIALLLGLAVGIYADGFAQQRIRDRLATGLQVTRCMKGDQRP